jgi:hypothetical protein
VVLSKEQANRIESPEIEPHKYNQVIFDKNVQGQSNGVMAIFSPNGTGKWIPTANRQI